LLATTQVSLCAAPSPLRNCSNSVGVVGANFPSHPRVASAGQDAGDGVEMRGHAFIAGVAIKQRLGKQVPRQVRNVHQPLRGKGFGAADPAKNHHHHALSGAAGPVLAPPARDVLGRFRPASNAMAARRKSRLDRSMVASGTPEMTRKTLSPVGFICSVHTALPEYNSPPFSSSSRFSCRAPPRGPLSPFLCFVIPNGARDLLFAKAQGKSRFLTPFKKRMGFGMTLSVFLAARSVVPSAGLSPTPTIAPCTYSVCVARKNGNVGAPLFSLRHSERSEESLFFSAERPPWQTPSRAQERECRRADNCT